MVEGGECTVGSFGCFSWNLRWVARLTTFCVARYGVVRVSVFFSDEGSQAMIKQ